MAVKQTYAYDNNVLLFALNMLKPFVNKFIFTSVR